MSNQYDCPHCSSPVTLTEAMAGQKVRCPRCSEIFKAPGGARHAMPPKVPQGAQDVRKMSSARLEYFRRRRKWSFVKPLLFTIAASAILVGVGSFVWRDLQKKGVLDDMFESRKITKKEDVGLGRGFHIMPDDYWEIFDDSSLLAKPVVKAPEAKAGGKKIDAEGLSVHPMQVDQPYYIVNDMGGLVPSAVGIWVSPNRLGQGREAFYGEPGEEVKVTHWVRNFGGFKVYRILNKKKRRGPGNKLHDAGWLLGIYLEDEDGRPIR